ncbi:uncharacterized protein LOC127259960 [Andrographis paniculata]|uniref:uncharacterized protein LOC127259960 n=1 Tax=Andrographis paniculata TaxID=175694 RepID=UPI0021E83A68|nr:uncharacterized protein LOC127259960 [Andrographis paniculata]
MGKSISSPPKLHQFARFVASADTRRRRPLQLNSLPTAVSSPDSTLSKFDSHELRIRMETGENSERRQRMPLAEVVEDCVKRWFQDTLKEAKNGDTSMQVLVAQMYYSGYGVARDAQKGRAWISRASRHRSSAWKVGDKHPGYNASDSDSEDAKEDAG